MIIEQLYGFTKFRNILFKSYFIDSKEFLPDSFISTKILLAKTSSIKIFCRNTSCKDIPNKTVPTSISLIKYIVKSSLKILNSLALVKQSHKQLENI